MSKSTSASKASEQDTTPVQLPKLATESSIEGVEGFESGISPAGKAAESVAQSMEAATGDLVNSAV